MKFLMITSLLFASQLALGRMPPYDSSYVRPGQFAFVINSPEVIAKFREIGAKDIPKISYSKGSFTLSDFDGRQVTSRPIYSRPEYNGQCPTLIGVEIESATCPAELNCSAI